MFKNHLTKKMSIIAMMVFLCLSVLSGFGILWWNNGPYVEFTVVQHFVDPEDDAIRLILRNASLARIQAAVKESGKSVNDIKWQGTSLLGYAVQENRENVVIWLLEQGADPNAMRSAGAPLLIAIHRENIAMTKLLLDHGADPDLDTRDGITPRWVAVDVVKNDEVIKLLQKYPKR
jgi:ankyrin repeat protein